MKNKNKITSWKIKNKEIVQSIEHFLYPFLALHKGWACDCKRAVLQKGSQKSGWISMKT